MATTQVNVKPYVQIVDGEINRKSFKKGENVHYSFTIDDVATKTVYDSEEMDYFIGISRVHLLWSSGTQIIEQYYDWKPENGETGMRVEGDIKIKKGMKPGVWKLKEISLVEERDRYNQANPQGYIYFDMPDDGYDNGDSCFSIKVCIKDDRVKKEELNKYKNDLPYWMDFTDLSFADFVVKGTKADTKAPKVDLTSLKLSKKRLKKNQKATFSLKVKDSSEILFVGARFFGDEFKELKYNKTKKCYEYSISATKYKGQVEELESIFVYDRYGNSKEYFGKTGSKTEKAFQKITVRRK